MNAIVTFAAGFVAVYLAFKNCQKLRARTVLATSLVFAGTFLASLSIIVLAVVWGRLDAYARQFSARIGDDLIGSFYFLCILLPIIISSFVAERFVRKMQTGKLT